MAAADNKLLANFMVCAMPGLSPMKNIFPMFFSTGVKRS